MTTMAAATARGFAAAIQQEVFWIGRKVKEKHGGDAMRMEWMERLAAIKNQAEQLRDEIENEVEGGEMMVDGLWNISGSIDQQIGCLMAHAYKAGHVTFTDIKPAEAGHGKA